MTDHSLLKCCGNCARFACEDVDGYGWCLSVDREMKCSDVCDFHEERVGDDSADPV